MIDLDLLKTAAAPFGVELTPEMGERFDLYARRLVEWNGKINLTAITDPAGIAVKHFADSLTAAPLLPTGELSLVDVGTGAGFPGVPLAILRPELSLTLLDSLQKRLTFLETVCGELGVTARFVHARAEEAGRDPALREKFDVATARAVAALPALCEYCLPLVRPGGRMIALKGPDADRELAEAARAIGLLGGKPGEMRALTLSMPDGEVLERRLACIDKIAPTPPKYPRPTAKMAKNPL